MTFKYSKKLKQGYITTENSIYPIDMQDFQEDDDDYWNAFIDEIGNTYDINIGFYDGRFVTIYNVKDNIRDNDNCVSIIDFQFTE